MRDAIGKYHGGEVIPEEPAKGESQSNGVVEEAGKTVREFTRVYKEQIEEKTGIELASDSPIILWVIRWAAMARSRFKVGEDGKTAYERRKMRKCRLEVVPIGEKVWYKQIREGKDRKDKITSEEKEGVWLGHARTSNEILIGTRQGVVRAYSVSRQSEDQRWDGQLIQEMVGTPQKPDPKREGTHIPIKVTFDSPEEAEADQAREKQEDVRRMRITADMLAEYGYTDGCEGCRFKKAGMKGTRPHSERCRSRIMEVLSKAEEGWEKIQQDQRRIDWRKAEREKKGEREDGRGREGT